MISLRVIEVGLELMRKAAWKQAAYELCQSMGGHDFQFDHQSKVDYGKSSSMICKRCGMRKKLEPCS